MLTLYHNPRCSKSREALAVLQARGLPLRVHEYLAEPLDLAQLRALQRALGAPAREMLRSGEEAYAQLGLDDPAIGDDELLAAIAAHPLLLQRPIVVDGDRAVIARPPELALQFLDQAL